MVNKKIIIYGFGRMGLTHYAILNQLLCDARFTFVDPDTKIAFVGKKNLDLTFLGSDSNLSTSFDYALICTPPMFHVDILKRCIIKGIPNIFVEKPFGGLNSDYSGLNDLNSRVAIGYVLRFNPIVNWVKKNVDIHQILSIHGSYQSNTIEKKPSGWRNSTFSGVTNEVGSHILDLCVYLFGLESPSIVRKSVDSVITDVDDIVNVSLEDKSVKYQFSFNWVNKNLRKPVFSISIFFKNNIEWRFDQQKLEIFDNGKYISQISGVDLAVKVPFYLRGVDFTLQMQDFLSDQKDIASLSDALVTRDIIKNILL